MPAMAVNEVIGMHIFLRLRGISVSQTWRRGGRYGDSSPNVGGCVIYDVVYVEVKRWLSVGGDPCLVLNPSLLPGMIRNESLENGNWRVRGKVARRGYDGTERDSCLIYQEREQVRCSSCPGFQVVILVHPPC